MPPFHCVLIADNPARRRALETLFRGAGLVVVPLVSKDEAIESLATPGIDLVAVDLALSVLDIPTLQRAIDPTRPGPPDTLEQAERRHIAFTMEYTGGNRRQAARLLGIARSTMLAKLRKYGLEDIT